MTSDKINSINELNLDTIYILSNSDLNEEERKLIHDSLISKGLVFKNIEYSIDKKLILGIELRARSYVLSWNVKELTANFIARIEKEMIDKK